MAFVKGTSGNPAGRRPSVKSVHVTARTHATDAVEILANIMQDDTLPAGARVDAANAVLALALDIPKKVGDQ